MGVGVGLGVCGSMFRYVYLCAGVCLGVCMFRVVYVCGSIFRYVYVFVWVYV